MAVHAWSAFHCFGFRVKKNREQASLPLFLLRPRNNQPLTELHAADEIPFDNKACALISFDDGHVLTPISTAPAYAHADHLSAGGRITASKGRGNKCLGHLLLIVLGGLNFDHRESALPLQGAAIKLIWPL
jgi:hypothetical protein